MSIQIPSTSDIKQVINQLLQAINADAVQNGFGGELDGEIDKVSLFEKAFGVQLPEDFKIFLARIKGGFMAKEKANYHWLNVEECCEQMSSYFLSINEIIEEYESCSLDDYKLRSGFEGFYPYIPFYITSANEKLVFVNAHEGESSQFVFAAFHDEPASAWFVVAKSFTDFLIKYINTDGKPNLYEEDIKVYAEDSLDALDNHQEEIDNPKERIKRATAYLKLFPDDTVTYNSRGNAYRDNGQYEEAMTDYKKSLEIDPKYSLTYYCRGSMLLSLEKARQALTDFDSACQLEPDDPLFLTGRADAFYEMNMMEKALADCNKAIEIDKRYYIAYSIRRNIYLYLGEADKAASDAAFLDEISNEN